MFSTHRQLEKRTGKSGTPRLEYLQELVNEYQNTSDQEAKYQVLANLANFAYDPINYEWLWELNVVDLFLGSSLTDTLTEPDEKIKEFGLSGLCNLCLEKRNKEHIMNNDGVPLVIDCIFSEKEDIILSAITTLMFLISQNDDDEKGDEQLLVRKLADKSDVLIENFRPGVMEKWGLGPEELYKTNPSLIYTRVSGFGQTGPYAKKPGFASVCEAMAGWRYINGFPNQPPVRQNISLGDSLTGLTAALGTVLGLLARNKIAQAGQVVDAAIYESMFNMMEGVLPEYDRFGEIRQPSGTSVTGIVPTNAYPCSDSKHVIIGGNTDSLYKKLMKVVGREDLTTSDYETNKERVIHERLIDGAISEWTRKHTSEEVVERLEEEGIPCGHIYNIKDIVEDKHVQSRNVLETVKVGENREDGGWDLKTPGETTWAGPDLGQHNREVLVDILGIGEDKIRELQEHGIVGKTL
ncbi:13288_t:CDS:10 [Acaulospora colombiana]|uniref:13288_t:CDS:1 n=1 Tax=Acaulospora colombiana TaxID=27376 RepID=A0ACA9JVZ9_9GLOM|nr:13288_t:CDS:10 [Acaulospora colombiana]